MDFGKISARTNMMYVMVKELDKYLQYDNINVTRQDGTMKLDYMCNNAVIHTKTVN